jgi:hypothetical protein
MSLSGAEVCSTATFHRGLEAASAAPARRLLRAAEVPGSGGFEMELNRARLVAAQTLGRDAEDVERLELLAAVAADLDVQWNRAGEGKRSVSLETNVQLLLHMAGVQRPRTW